MSMMITQKTANGFGYLSLAVLLVLFILDALGLLPAHLRMPLFFLALALFMVRLTLRLLLERQRRQEEKKEGPGTPG